MSESKHNTDRHTRRIRSFVRREGRLTPGQQKALEHLWPHYGLTTETTLNRDDAFGRTAPITMEIGFGNGASLASMAQQAPECDFVGIEVHRPGVGHLLKLADEQRLSNLRLYNHDAVEVITDCIDDHSLDRVLLFFPDPWHKKKHQKRRIVQPRFAALLARKLKPGGHFHMATDWQHYAQHMLRVMDATTTFTNTAGKQHYSERPDYRPVTRFELRGRRLGHGVWDLIYRRN